MTEKNVRVGVGVFVIREGKFLMGLRKGSLDAGKWGLPGGHLEWKEEWDVCGCREITEESGCKIANIRFLSVTNDIFKEENKHYVTLFLTSDWVSGEPEVKEPDKCEKWDWFTFTDLPDNLSLPIKNLVEGRKHSHELMSERRSN